MKILWITNLLLPKAAESIGQPTSNGGGWLQSSAKALLKTFPSLQLAIATVSPYVEILTIKIVDEVTYYILPLKGDIAKYNKELEQLWQKVYDDFNPILVHLHGTEYAHGLAYLKANSSSQVVVSIQGLVSVISNYYNEGLSFRDILKNITFRDVVRLDSLWNQKKKFCKRGCYEVQILQNVKYVIGRTSWDKSHVWAINPEIKYYSCEETLRDGFYINTWNYYSCEHYSIFVSQATYPVKGLHQLLKAMPLILSHYPNAKIYVAGSDVTKYETLGDKIRISGYGKYIKRMIDNLGLNDKVFFTGSLSEKQMIDRYLRSNVFVCPSSIENSPNSLGEAQILGVPCVASYVGGIPDMMKGNEENLYRFEEVEMLAEKVCKIFSNKDKHKNMIEEATRRHNPETNSNRLFEIYKSIIEK
ncbi:glycosyltransferase [uncultured Parabacteroides sp.]|uniref:glycosyltransferase n=1 Tax=uncultured Parabacteroides sp. TaxID=512312 RepID=UPI002806125B|nr:glycosyltransferase [uncultured Parabacteroides sp.]